MKFDRLVFSGHATVRMFERDISVEAVREVATSNEVIADDPEDTPYPSCFLLGWWGGLPLHVA